MPEKTADSRVRIHKSFCVVPLTRAEMVKWSLSFVTSSPTANVHKLIDSQNLTAELTLVL